MGARRCDDHPALGGCQEVDDETPEPRHPGAKPPPKPARSCARIQRPHHVVSTSAGRPCGIPQRDRVHANSGRLREELKMAKAVLPRGSLFAPSSPLHSEWGKLAALLVWCFLLRAPTFLRSVIDGDESLYVLVADRWGHGCLPYIAVWDHKPPGVYVLFLMAFGALGHSLIAIRILASAFVFGAAVLIYGIGYVATGERPVALVAAAAYPAFSILWRGTAANVEHFFIVFDLAAALVLTVIHVRRPTGAQRWWRVLAAGLCFGLALQLKYIAIFEIAFFFVLYAFREWQILPAASRGRLLGELAAMIAMAIVPTAAAAAYFLAFGQLGEFVDANFFANVRHAVPHRSMETVISGVLSLGRWLAESGPLWVAPVFLFLRRPTVPGCSPIGSRRVALVLAAWVLVGLVEAASTSRFYAHYFLVTLPPLCLLAGEAWRWGGSIRRSLGHPVVWAMVLCAFPVTFISILDYREWIAERLSGMADEPARVASYIRPRLRPGESIYVVDSEPIIYFLADAQLPTRYAFPPFLMDEHFSAVARVDYKREFESILRQEPRCIVLQNPGRPRARELRAMLGSEYGQNRAFDTIDVICRNRSG